VVFFASEYRTRGGEKLDLHDDRTTYTVWISFAEMYNENIYDLFQRVPEVGYGTQSISLINKSFNAVCVELMF
jgi:hypothetical protein